MIKLVFRVSERVVLTLGYLETACNILETYYALPP